MVKKFKNIVLWTYDISNLNGEEIGETFYKKELEKPNQTEFRTEKVIKTEGSRIYVKWKDFNSSFNSWIDNKDIA